MFGLEPGLLILLILCLVAACGFEFVNGFHDTANAVATVIYTNALKPNVAVVWAGFCNFVGVFSGGIAVAMGIVYLLPVELLIDQDIYHSVAMVLALLLSAIIWNLGTWYLGLPSSSSHTLIGSILGVGLAFSFMPESTGAAVNWNEATKIGLSLIVSPLFGFGFTILLMFLLRRFTNSETLFREPLPNQPPPPWIRGVLIATCTGVSFFHGSNDGQKGVGLVMLILIGIIPSYFALNAEKNPSTMQTSLSNIERALAGVDASQLTAPNRPVLQSVKNEVADLQQMLALEKGNGTEAVRRDRLSIRKDILLIANGTNKILADQSVNLPAARVASLKGGVGALKEYTDYAPTWVLLMISVSLGLGTMVGWKRIVKTVGEKIGKQHLTYAQGASAELVAASTIGVASGLGLPVSTTHVLSSGIAGSMVANKGLGNLQPQTVRSIALAWVLTLPVSILLSGSLYVFFRWLF
ncbi:MAG: inorganic phosphate transporter [Ferruginibacter sp.]|nr:inorganic phosphate transporter [Cytophagales bacterium]